MENSTYEAYTFCENCHSHKKTEIPKGSTINETSCPVCGNLTLKIDPNGEIFSRPKRPPNYI